MGEQQEIAFFAGRTAVLATMHRKETVIAPLLQAVGLQVVVPVDFNTDQFGTFSREIKRSGSQLEAARLKAEQAIKLTDHSIGIASEGAFGPHPAMPYLACNRELVVLIDRQHQLEIVGEALSTETNFRQTQVTTPEAAQQFAAQVGFPDHGLVVIAGGSQPSRSPEPDQIIKGITSEAELHQAVSWALAQAETAWIETDMRAMYNPTRMRVIQQATENLIQKMRCGCPQCGCPGFDQVEVKPGLPCGWCNQPTALRRAVVYRCQVCGTEQETEFPDGITTADPAYCNYCNP
jgi:hypothetical protein